MKATSGGQSKQWMYMRSKVTRLTNDVINHGRSYVTCFVSRYRRETWRVVTWAVLVRWDVRVRRSELLTNRSATACSGKYDESFVGQSVWLDCFRGLMEACLAGKYAFDFSINEVRFQNVWVFFSVFLDFSLKLLSPTKHMRFVKYLKISLLSVMEGFLCLKKTKLL